MLKLRQFSKHVLNKLMLRQLPGPYRHVQGYCWSADLPALAHLSISHNKGTPSPLLLYEDAVACKRPYSSHDDIYNLGLCRFSHWKDKVFFSTSDNSDPNTNGRAYHYSTSSWLIRRRLGLLNGKGVIPCNHLLREASPEQIQADVDYALAVGLSHLCSIRSFFPDLNDKSVLEVGPGINYGAVMVLACYGMRPLVSDRFLSPWESLYHRSFYSFLADALLASDPHVDVSPLKALVKADRYDNRVITCVPTSIEEISLPEESVDVVFSNAVVEHLFDVKRSFEQLYRITRPGGYGLHQVDFRDHRSFDHPLEYLLLEEQKFQKVATACFLECGNRFRPDETTSFIQSAGFELISFVGNRFSTEDYLKDFLPRLRLATGSRYRHLTVEELRTVSGSYLLHKSS